MPVELRLYDHTNADRLDVGSADGVLDEAYGLSSWWQRNRYGRGELSVDVTPQVLDVIRRRQVVRWYDNGQHFRSSIIETDPQVDADETVTLRLAGPGLEGWLGTSDSPGAVLASLEGETERRFGWTSLDYDDSAWDPPTTLGQQSSRQWRSPSSLRGQPQGWMDPLAEWLWSDDLVGGTTPAGISYFRRRLEVAAVGKQGQARIYFTANNWGKLYFDDRQVIDTSDRKNVRELFQTDVELDEVHQLAVEVTSRGDSPYPGSFLMTIVALDEDGDEGGVLYRSFSPEIWGTGDPGPWVCLHLPGFIPGVTPGGLVDRLAGEAQDRGWAPTLTWTFDAEVDSFGTPWPTEYNLSFSTGVKYGWIMEQLAQLAGCDWDVTPDGELRMWVSRGDDLTGSVSLTPYTDRSLSGGGVPGNALQAQTDGGVSWSEDVTRQSQFGRLEDGATFGNAETPDQMQSAIEAMLDDDTETVDVEVDADGPAPLDGFDLADRVSVDGRDGVTSGLVEEFTMVVDDDTGHVDWGATVKVAR